MSPEKTAPRRGRPRAFDETEVLDKAIEVFWTYGYEATSLDHLMAGTGLSRASIYAAFGDKERFFVRAIGRVASRIEETIAGVRADGRAPREVILAHFRFVVGMYQSGDVVRGCFISVTGTGPATTNPVIREALLDAMLRMDQAFVGLLRRLEVGDDDADRLRRAKLASYALQALGIRARVGASDDELNGMAELLAAQVTGG